MRATTLALILAMAIPVAAAPEDNVTAAADGQPAVSVQAPSSEAQRPAPPAPTPAGRKRRGSMVGYIADAALENQIRVRADAAFHDNRPDRDEFFYAQCGCNGAGKPGPEGLATDLQFQQVTVDAQYAVHNRVAVFAAIPVRFIQPQTFLPGAGTFANQSGLSDIRAGGKLALVSADDTLVTAQVQGYFQTGDGAKGLGTNHATIEPALLVYQRLSDRVAIESQLGDWHPIGGTNFGLPAEKYDSDVLFYGIGPSFELVSTSRVKFAPVIELVGWHLFGGLQVQPPPPGVVVAADSNIVNLKIGARTTVGRNSLYVGYGRALTDAVWYRDIVRIEYRYSF
jgi:hypothetical protein